MLEWSRPSDVAWAMDFLADLRRRGIIEHNIAAFKRRKARFEAAGLDYYSSFTIGHRHIANVKRQSCATG